MKYLLMKISIVDMQSIKALKLAIQKYMYMDTFKNGCLHLFTSAVFVCLLVLCLFVY